MIRSVARRQHRLSWRTVLLVLVILGALILAATIVRIRPPERSQPIEISTSEWLPYISPDLPHDGPLAEMITSVLGRAGYTPAFRFTTWPLAERDVRAGASVGMAPVVRSPARADFGLYSDSLLDFRYTLFGKRGEQLDAIPGRTDLTGLRVARIQGYQYWPELESSGAEFRTYPSSLAAFSAVQSGEADLVAEGRIAGQSVLVSPEFTDDATAYGEVTPAGPLTSSTQGLHLLVKDSAEGRRMLEQFDQALAQYKETDEYASVQAALTSSTDQVILGAGGGGANVFDVDGAPAGIAPSGTRAAVLTWPDGVPQPDQLVRVKIVDGPLTGRVLQVRIEDVELAAAGSAGSTRGSTDA